ncbi:MAG: PDZ domain-containing protein [Gemmatimonadetes bacterium]|nr:PDZ domain-containing protein [Gemmatimonadota bacterium]
MTLAPLAAAAALLAGTPPSAPAQAGGFPLRPGGIGVQVGSEAGAARVRQVLGDGPAAHAGVREGDRLLAVDGRPVAGWPSQRVEEALVGAVGTPVRLALRDGTGAVREVALRREDVFAPAPGETGIFRTPHFVVHFRPGGDERAFARRYAERAERWLRDGAGGAPLPDRRAHLYLVERPGVDMGNTDVRQRRLAVLPWWGSYVNTLPFERDAVGPALAYVTFGAPGPDVERYLGGRRGWESSADGVHRVAVASLLAADVSRDASPELLSRTVVGLPAAGASLRAYVRERYGDRRFGELWRSDRPFPEAVRQVLGTSDAELLAEWRDRVFTLGPSPEKGARGESVALGLGYGLLLLGFGAWVARRKEVG